MGMNSAIQMRIVAAAILFAMFVLPLGIVCAQVGQHEDLPDPDFDFKTFFVTRPGLTDPTFDAYLKEAQPEIVQVGYYGPMLHGYGDSKGATGYPMNLPASGVDNLLDIFGDVNSRIHEQGLKAVGHFQTGKVIGAWDDKSHFYDFYMNKWDEKLLGPKPHPDVLEIVQRDAQGRPLEQGRNANTTYVGLCLSSPHTRQMLKQMLKVAIDAGVDGVMTNFNYRWDCVCPYCQQLFRAYLDERFTDQTLAERFDIADIKTHTFDAIPASIPGYPEPGAKPLEWEAKRWGAKQFKDAFDEILIEYGRSVNPDLIVATWNHIGNVSHNEERTFLPIERWGRGENYFWYSGGAAFVGKKLDQSKAMFGDAWLLMHYLRAFADGKPIVLGKYDRNRMRVSIAEAAATGGGGMGRYMRFLDPLAYLRLVEYTRFVHEHRALYDDVNPVGEIGIVAPRQSVQNGMPNTYENFRGVGESLVRSQRFIEVVVDQKLTAERLESFAITILPDVQCLSDEQWQAIESHAKSGGVVMLRGEVGTHDENGQPRANSLRDAISDLPNVYNWAIDDDAKMAAMTEFLETAVSQIDGQLALRAAAYDKRDARIVHFVNYAYDQEKLEALGRNPGAEGELPLPQRDIKVDLRIPVGREVASVQMHQPEQDAASPIEFEQNGSRVQFTIDQMLVYAVVEVRYSDVQ